VAEGLIRWGTALSKFDAVNSSLGYATTGLEVAGSLAAPASALAAVGAAATVVGLVATPVILLLGKIFRGADPRQVPAAKIEQAFEAGACNVGAVARAGMLSQAEALAAMQLFLQKGDEFYKEMAKGLGPAGERGKANMHKVIGDWITALRREVALTRKRPLNLAAARKLYIPVTKSGWYRESLEAGARLADSYLASLPQNVAEKASSVLSAPLSNLLPLPLWVLAVGALALGGVLGGVK